MAHAWKACWGNTLGGSNPPSSALEGPVTCRDVGGGPFAVGGCGVHTGPVARTDRVARVSAVASSETLETPSRARRLDRLALPGWAIGSAVLSGVALVFRWGYQFGVPDQAVLAVRGIAAADPDAFVNDWFDQAAPQPHWLFDLVTYVGEATGALPLVYLLYWFASLLVFGAATALLARHWLPRDVQYLGLLVGPVVVAAPVGFLGSTSPLLAWALPHVLGGCLAYLALAALITSRQTLLRVVAPATALVHVQHGANLAVILLAASLVLAVPRRRRVELAGLGVFNVVVALVVTRVRGIVGNGNDFVEICRDVAPFHCEATGWPRQWFVDGFVLTALVLFLLLVRRDDRRALLVVVALPTVGLLAGVYADWANVPVLGELAQRTNVYRLVTLLVPFAAWVVVGAAVLPLRGLVRRVGALAVTGALSVLLLIGGTGAFEFHRRAAVVIAALILVPIALKVVGRAEPWTWVAGAVVPFVLVGSVVVSDAFVVRGLPVGPGPDDARFVVGEAVRDATPPGSVVAAAPSADWLRFFSRRAVIADCKAVPYGGVPWDQYQERIAALGGRNCGTDANFAALPLESLEDLAERFDATHALLSAQDPKVAAAEAAGWDVVLDPTDPGALGYTVVEIPRAGGR